MKKAILILVAVLLIWGALAMYFLGSLPLAELTKLPVQVFDCLSVVLGFAGFCCIVFYNEKKRASA